MALAYAGAKQYQQSDVMLASIQGDWINDQRLSVAYAMVGLNRKDLHSAQEWLIEPALKSSRGAGLDAIKDLHAGVIDRNLIEKLKKYDPNDWPRYLEQAIISEQYYFTLLWKKQYEEALLYANDILSKLQSLNVASGKWLERAGDAAFYSQAFEGAIEYYKSALEFKGSCYCIYLKLADIYHLNGNLILEREYRQLIYGQLDVMN